ncbi:DUF3857 domain-containing protein [Altererythrobacter salegens]|uniref:DUF3857 domain-containing protein n=1 Tax=Croceibacterium salegens TaxID=1737568 RepID=A0A6I4SXX4_9SPHN|nr:DUF3857 domain-containing protein [Croceibacterium salegens]MXO59162.1 DUF3857 domain-containing protein [Croceibacterium salegens]
MYKHLFLLTSAAITAPAMAGEEPLYQPAPAWVSVKPLPADTKGPTIVLYDDERRLVEGTVTNYTDRALRVDNPQMLNTLGTIQAPWLPDKGDLIIHRVEIIRGAETIDVLAQGSKFDVLRREQQLEQRTLTGAMTATMTVPGLRVGDILRVAYSMTVSDQTLGKEVQAVVPLIAAPVDAKSASVQLSWPVGSDIRWSTTHPLHLPEPVAAGGFESITVMLPLAKPEDMPGDAPARFKLPNILQAGSFAGWQEVSSVMAPLYATDGTIAADSPLAAEVAKIVAASDDKMTRMAAALRLVQDEVAYLAVGMEGGNYIPQSPADTWQKRYGDCKAKTLLLLALLHAMDIKAEPALVSSVAGDAVSEMLPMPGAFDHIIVHATLGGEEYWLDGTDSGATLATLKAVPPFRNALPVRAEGAGLVAMTPRRSGQFDRSIKITYDNRPGLDLPMLFDAEWTVGGSFAGTLRALIDQAGKDQMDDLIAGFVASSIGPTQVIEGSMTFDAANNRAIVKVKGLMTTLWRWDRGQGKRQLNLVTTGFEFKPDRSRKAWSEIPVELDGPSAQMNEVTILLPDTEGKFELEGKTTLDEDIAGTHLERSAKIEGNRFFVTDFATSQGGELPADQAMAERSRASRLGSLALTLEAPRDVSRRFEFAGKRDRSRLAPIEQAYAKLIERKPDDADNYLNRARFRSGTYDRDGALADMNKVIELAPDTQAYWTRSGLLLDLGRLDDALADARAASDLDPSVGSAIYEAQILAELDRVDEAIAIVENLDGDANERQSIGMELSDLYAQAGRKDDGFAKIEDLLAERPGDPTMLNARCWFKASWNYQPDDLAQVCTRAVEQSSWSPPVLDSRAMAYFRLGRLQEALDDIDAALLSSPELSPTLLMRGVVRKAMGDKKGSDDIAAALARDPSLERKYAHYGISVR